jgi:Protein of unknown function (DUF2974)
MVDTANRSNISSASTTNGATAAARRNFDVRNTVTPADGNGLGAAPAAPLVSARVTGADALSIGRANIARPQEFMQWNQPQGPVQFGATPIGPGQLTQVQQERLAPLAAEANAPTPPSATTLALLSADVYRDAATPPAGYRVATEADLGKLGLNPQDLTSTQSAFRARVYVTGAGADQQFVVAFRGSTSDRSDWIANGRQAAGLETDHYSRALAIGRAVARNSDDPVTMTGHSLGGGLASAAAVASGTHASTFNSAGLSENTIRAANSIRMGAGVSGTADVNAYYVRGEILSLLQDGGDQMLGGFLGRMAGSWAAGPVGGAAGRELGRYYADAPEAYGNRIALDPVRPSDVSWWQNHPVTRHGIDYVLSSLRAANL